MHETPNNNNNNGAPKSTDPAVHPLSHCSEPTSTRPLNIPSSQECKKDENSLRKGRKQKTTTLATQRCPNGHDEIHNMHPTEIPSPDHISWCVKDRLIGKIACMVCGEKGHYTCDCPMKAQENKVLCTLCNKVGHCYLWCCRQHVSENRACRRCGEKGHYTNKDLSHCDEKYTNMYVRCSSCDESHPLGRCPMGKVTCFLCEGKDHVPAQCRLSPMLTATQHYRESFQAILKQALTKTSRRAVTPAKLSSKLEPHDDSHEPQLKRNDKMVHMVPSIIRCEQGDCEKNVTRSVLNSNETKNAALTGKALTQGSSSACFNCHEEGHYANRCPEKKPPGELELGDVTCFRFRAKKCHKKSTKLMQSDVTCFICHDKGHYSYSCPANKPSGGLELRDITCINFDANTCDWKKPSRELLCDVSTCFKCHDKGHYSYNCPKSKPPGQGQNAKSCPKKKRKREQ